MMNTSEVKLKTDILGYGTIILFSIFILSTHLLLFCIFLLFLYLFTDFFTNYVHQRLRVIPEPLLFWGFNGLVIAFVIFLGSVIVPNFVAGFPRYYEQIVEEATALLSKLTLHYGFTVDWSAIKDMLYAEIGYLVKIVNDVSKNIIYFIFAVACNILLYIERKKIHVLFDIPDENLFMHLYHFIVSRLRCFYKHFKEVMGGQLIISMINTGITAIVVLSLGLPHKINLICIVFICGLLPVIGNIISNSILSIIALISNGVIALIVCLILLITIHKLEYFLNSRIIGGIVRLPMVVILLVLLVGEATMGVLGMILAIPLALTIRDELMSIKTPSTQQWR